MHSTTIEGDQVSGNPLDVFDVELPISDEELRSIYVSLVKRHPPERDPEAFQRIRHAYGQLRTPADRARWALRRVERPPLSSPTEEGEVAGPLGIPASWWLMADPWAELERTEFASDCRDPLAHGTGAAPPVAAASEGEPQDA